MTDTSGFRYDLTSMTPTLFTSLHELAGAVDEHARAVGLDPRLIELVRLRASEINGCGYCRNLHTQQARERGESEHRLQNLAMWRDAGCFSAAERSALRLTESITLLPGGVVPDSDYQAAQEFFDDKQLVGLVWTVSMINTYNRLAVTMNPET